MDDVNYLTNSSLMEVDFLPEHLVILGGGYIALEFGQMFSALWKPSHDRATERQDPFP